VQDNGVERRADARGNRVRVIEAAKETFAEKGIIAAEMKEIAERAGVGVGTIYRNFPNKDDLIAEIVREAVAEIEQTIATAEEYDDAIVGLREALTELFHVVERLGWLIDAVLSGQLPESVKAEVDAQQKERDNRGFHRIIRRGIEQGRIRNDVNVEVVVAFLAGTLAPWNLERIRSNVPAEQLADEIVDVLLRGAAAP
jgi:AcrR family transcriptional regulator